jgi:hypothetical protein
MADPTHKLFIDDSGDKDYTHDNRYGPVGVGPTPYFVFAGLVVSPLEASGIDQAMRTLKRHTFGVADVEIKANWLRIPKERKRRFLDKYNITEAELTTFTDALYEITNDAECRLLACVVNKAQVRAMYGERARHPPGIAYECLLQRVQREMVTGGGRASLTIDHMTGATQSGNQHRLNLERQHARLKKFGSDLLRGVTFDRVEGLSFRDSKDDERLQLADLVAYGVYRQFVEHGPDWTEHSGPSKRYEYLDRLLPKFCRSQSGRVLGYGIVKFPR